MLRNFRAQGGKLLLARKNKHRPGCMAYNSLYFGVFGIPRHQQKRTVFARFFCQFMDF